MPISTEEEESALKSLVLAFETDLESVLLQVELFSVSSRFVSVDDLEELVLADTEALKGPKETPPWTPTSTEDDLDLDLSLDLLFVLEPPLSEEVPVSSLCTSVMPRLVPRFLD